MRKPFQYRLYPNKTQEQTLFFWLRRCRELYNACLEESRAAWTMQGKSLSAFDQINELPDLKQAFPAYQELPSQVLQDVIRRHFEAKQAFFRRVANGEKPGYPRYKTTARYRSLTFPSQAGWKLEAKHLVFNGPGRMRIKLHRPVEGRIKTLSIKRDVDQWYACFVCEVDLSPPLPPSEKAIGIDLGVLRFATLSDGTQIENPSLVSEVSSYHCPLGYDQEPSGEAEQATQASSYRSGKSASQGQEPTQGLSAQAVALPGQYLPNYRHGRFADQAHDEGT